jgi:hypothetical protein
MVIQILEAIGGAGTCNRLLRGDGSIKFWCIERDIKWGPPKQNYERSSRTSNKSLMADNDIQQAELE